MSRSVLYFTLFQTVVRRHAALERSAREQSRLSICISFFTFHFVSWSTFSSLPAVHFHTSLLVPCLEVDGTLICPALPRRKDELSPRKKLWNCCPETTTINTASVDAALRRPCSALLLRLFFSDVSTNELFVGCVLRPSTHPSPNSRCPYNDCMLSLILCVFDWCEWVCSSVVRSLNVFKLALSFWECMDQWFSCSRQIMRSVV